MTVKIIDNGYGGSCDYLWVFKEEQPELPEKRKKFPMKRMRKSVTFLDSQERNSKIPRQVRTDPSWMKSQVLSPPFQTPPDDISRKSKLISEVNTKPPVKLKEAVEKIVAKEELEPKTTRSKIITFAFTTLGLALCVFIITLAIASFSPMLLSEATSVRPRATPQRNLTKIGNLTPKSNNVRTTVMVIPSRPQNMMKYKSNNKPPIPKQNPIDKCKRYIRDEILPKIGHLGTFLFSQFNYMTSDNIVTNLLRFFFQNFLLLKIILFLNRRMRIVPEETDAVTEPATDNENQTEEKTLEDLEKHWENLSSCDDDHECTCDIQNNETCEEYKNEQKCRAGYLCNLGGINDRFRKEFDAIQESDLRSDLKADKRKMLKENYRLQLKKNRELFLNKLLKLKQSQRNVIFKYRLMNQKRKLSIKRLKLNRINIRNKNSIKNNQKAIPIKRNLAHDQLIKELVTKTTDKKAAPKMGAVNFNFQIVNTDDSKTTQNVDTGSTRTMAQYFDKLTVPEIPKRSLQSSKAENDELIKMQHLKWQQEQKEQRKKGKKDVSKQDPGKAYKPDITPFKY